ncbi:YraN family protein [Castellaniella sp. FW104-16D08]|uniref:YraN family protein n=1 Tax=unclassified Castellaniella TaxID=2617606 RepID=UPI003315423F
MLIDPYARAQAAQDLIRKKRRRALRAAERRPSAVKAPSMRESPTQTRGFAAEAQAADYLQAHGLLVLARNLHCKLGELDLIAQDGQILVFIEVRMRQDNRHGGAAASVNRDKQARLIRTALWFLPSLCRLHFQGHIPPCRFDVIGVQGNTIEWIRNAFEA